MGVELSVGCTACLTWVWLGSAKPERWKGFQVGNDFLAQWLLEHAHSLPSPIELWRDDGGLPPWEAAPATWKEDERSLGVTMAGRQPAAFARRDLQPPSWGRALRLTCEHCGDDRAVARIAGGVAVLENATESAEWMLQHTAPRCALTAWVSRS